jgi:hypothetical protein
MWGIFPLCREPLPDPRSGLFHVIAAGAVLDAQNEVPACAVGLGHRVAVNTMTFFSGFCITDRTHKIEGHFCHVHARKSTPSV